LSHRISWEWWSQASNERVRFNCRAIFRGTECRSSIDISVSSLDLQSYGESLLVVLAISCKPGRREFIDVDLLGVGSIPDL